MYDHKMIFTIITGLFLLRNDYAVITSINHSMESTIEAGNPSVLEIDHLTFIATDVQPRRVLGILLLSIVLVRQSRLGFVERVGTAEPGHWADMCSNRERNGGVQHGDGDCPL
jgi:hypothetical protein